MRFFLGLLLLFNFCQGGEGYTYPQEAITYAGITIQCDEGCGTYEDPDLQHIWSILEDVTVDIFRGVMAFDTAGDAVLPSSPVRCNDSGDYERWDWKATNGVWPSDENLIYYKKMWIQDYTDFLEVASMLREDLVFYYFTVPQRVREFETNLVAKLEEGFRQGYNTYMTLPDGDIEFGHRRGNPLYVPLNADWEWIRFRLDYLDDYGFVRSESVSIQNQAYQRAGDLIERAITDMDALFRNIFIYCLTHHQPEGIAFSTAIEALLAGNLTKGIERIRAFIEIGESQQFHPDLMGKMHLLKGQLEIEDSLYADAILSLTQAIAKNQSLKEVYLERATAYFELGKYDHSIEDYLAYTAQIQGEDTFSIASFSRAFAKNLPSGAYESGRGLGLFLSDLVTHPIHTAKQVWESLSLLSKLAATKEWEELSQALAPEIHQLVIAWDHLSSEKRGEIAGYAFGKYGVDLLMPGALAKVVSKGLRYGTEVSAAYKSLRAADQTLLLESMAGCKNVAKFTEAMEAAQKTAFLGDELGFSAKEMGQLKQAGVLETTVAKRYDHLSLSMQESVALQKNARDALKPYVKKPMPEIKVRELIHETGMPTFPRPKGIPEYFLVMVADRGAGMEYVHPTNTHIRIRVMPGKPHSSNPSQQKPYVVQQKSGKAFDKQGDLIQPEKPEAHIPLEEFIYRE